jgi:hypothetical protein
MHRDYYILLVFLEVGLLATVLPAFCAFRTRMSRGFVAFISILAAAWGGLWFCLLLWDLRTHLLPLYRWVCWELTFLLPPLASGLVSSWYCVYPDRFIRFFRRFGWRLVCGILVLGVAAVLYVRIGTSAFEERWRHMAYGMTEAQTLKVLGQPTAIGRAEFQGVGGRQTTRWAYSLAWAVVHVDFDYTGPGGAPEVFRLEREIPR